MIGARCKRYVMDENGTETITHLITKTWWLVFNSRFLMFSSDLEA
jgi:hypothetical protein